MMEHFFRNFRYRGSLQKGPKMMKGMKDVWVTTFITLQKKVSYYWGFCLILKLVVGEVIGFTEEHSLGVKIFKNPLPYDHKRRLFPTFYRSFQTIYLHRSENTRLQLKWTG